MMMQHGRTFDKDLKLFIDEALIVIRKEREKMRLEEIRLEKIKLEEINDLKMLLSVYESQNQTELPPLPVNAL